MICHNAKPHSNVHELKIATIDNFTSMNLPYFSHGNIIQCIMETHCACFMLLHNKII